MSAALAVWWVLVWTAECQDRGSLVLLTEEMRTGAACLDGSAPAFYYSPGSGEGANKWFLHYQGGAFCVSLEDCYARSQTPLGSSKSYALNRTLDGGYFSSLPSENPLMYNWNKVYFMYCDGTFYMGDNSTTSYYNGSPLYFRGYRNTLAFYRRLVSQFNLNKGTDFVISGCSAGGVATLFLIDRWVQYLPANSKVRGLPDSGFFMDYEGTDLGKMVASALRWNFRFSNGTKNLDDSCKEAHKDDPEICAFSDFAAQYVDTPVFPLQSQHDSWQIQRILGSSDPVVVNAYGAIVRETFKSIILANPQNGCFLDSCYHHCQKWNSILIDNTLSGTAFYNWYIKGVGIYIQDQPYPCTSCCNP